MWPLFHIAARTILSYDTLCNQRLRGAYMTHGSLAIAAQGAQVHEDVCVHVSTRQGATEGEGLLECGPHLPPGSLSPDPI